MSRVSCHEASGSAAMMRQFLLHYCNPPQNHIPPEQEGQEVSRSGRVLWTQQLDCMMLLSQCPSIGEMLFNDTQGFMELARTECAALCLEAGHTVSPTDISLRLQHLPTLSSVPPSLPPGCGQLIQVCGSIVRMTTKRVVPFAYRRMCPRCRAVDEVHSNPFDRAEQEPGHCLAPGCKREGLQVVGQVWMDYAECRLQQRSNQSGKLPRSILVTLDDELSSKCTVGQLVEVVGMLFPKWRRVFPLSRPAVEPALWAINVLPMEAYRGATLMAGTSAAAVRRRHGRQSDKPKFSPETFFTSFHDDKRARGVALVNSVCPQLAGLFAPRLSILLASLGGASTTGKSSMHIRSTIHCLLVGDPSTGKSQLLRFAASVAPRSTSTTGMGSTSAGLTVAATKDQGEWVLEPGALVLSDGGACIIDELRTVSVADRASLHEAMEQQTISVAKGGLVTKLRTACSVISACNPPVKRAGRTEVGVGGPLLSRFDFIFLLWDTPQASVDALIADHVLSCNVSSHQPDPALGTEETARYLWWLRRQYSGVDGPLLSDAAADLLGQYYEVQRQRGATPALDDAVPVTVRMLESLVRITQAHAKLHLQPLCTIDDAAMAIFLMERTAHSLKCPLNAVGPDIYSSSRCLDDVFLSDSPDAVEYQGAVLDALVIVIQTYHRQMPSHHPNNDRFHSSDGGHRGSGVGASRDVPGGLGDGVLNAVRCSAATESLVKGDQQQQRLLPPWMLPFGGDSPAQVRERSGSAAVSSAAQLAHAVSVSRDTPRSFAQYPAGTFDRQWIHPQAILASQRAGPMVGDTTSAPPLISQVTSQQPVNSRQLPTSDTAGNYPTASPAVPLELTQAGELRASTAAAFFPETTDEDKDDDALLVDSDVATATPPLSQQQVMLTALTSTIGKRKRTADDIMSSLRFRF